MLLAIEQGNTNTLFAVHDGDGWAACAECDDTDPAVNPDAIESCNGVDDDCDGTIDEADAIDALTWYLDSPFNRLRPRDMSTGRFFELHTRLHGGVAFGSKKPSSTVSALASFAGSSSVRSLSAGSLLTA